MGIRHRTWMPKELDFTFLDPSYDGTKFHQKLSKSCERRMAHRQTNGASLVSWCCYSNVIELQQ